MKHILSLEFGLSFRNQEQDIERNIKENNMPTKTRRSTRQQAKENSPAVETSDTVVNIVNQEKNEKTVTSSANKLR